MNKHQFFTRFRKRGTETLHGCSKLGRIKENLEHGVAEELHKSSIISCKIQGPSIFNPGLKKMNIAHNNNETIIKCISNKK